MKKYKTIYVDPPWKEVGGRDKTGRKWGADIHYPVMSVEQIKSLKIPDLADPTGCHLYLWVTNNFLPIGLDVMKCWGFRYVTKVDWVKVNEKLQCGLGQYFRGASESCLFGVMGKVPYKKDENGKRMQGRTAIIAPRREHSQKPEEMRKMIEVVSYSPRIELFAREKSKGWDVWGDEIEGVQIEVVDAAV